jgi:hypothetical protein
MLSFQQFLCMYVGVFGGSSLECEAFYRRPLHVSNDFEHVSRIPFNDWEN